MTEAPRGRIRTLLRLLRYVRPYLLVVALALSFSALYAGGLSGRALLLMPLVDDIALPQASLGALEEMLEETAPADEAQAEAEREALRSRVRDNFWQLLFYGALLVLFMPLVRVVRDYASDWIMVRLLVNMQQDLGRKLLRLPLARHQRDRRGDLVARLTSDTMVANRAQAVIFGDALQDLMQVAIAVGISFWLSWQLALTFVLAGPPVFLVLRHFGERIRRASHSRQLRIADVTGRLIQMLSGIKVIQAFHAEEREARSFDGALTRFFKRSMRVVRNRVMSRAAIELVTQGSFVGVLLLGIFWVLQGQFGLTLGTLVAFATLSAMAYRPTKSIAATYNAIMDALPAADRLFEVLDSDEVVPDRPAARRLERVAREIRYRDVVFSYGREPVLLGIDFEIPAGHAVALVGRTGAGKTTIADLLLRFHEPVSGSIEIDGVDVREIERESLLALTAVVTQEAFLFDDSIAANIRYGRPEASMKEVVEAAKAANAHEFITRLPEGYDTIVGESGARVSGGQRQRLTIARALLKDPQILIFDEATSALDAHAEQEVQTAITRLMRGRTVLTIAHRLSTVRNADTIVVLESGRIAEQGTHETLLERAGLYAELVRLQLKG